MADEDILSRIDELVAEEHALRERAPSHGLNDDDRTRMRQLEEQLDQCWDLLRQRRARVEAGDDPDMATSRPIAEVESYEQ